VPFPGRRPAARAGAPPPAGVRYRFDDGFADDRGALPLRVVSAGGAIAMVERAGGRAVRFPPPCAHYGSARCARVILESGPAPFLNPGLRAIRFGATIRMAPEEASKGANVIQKGHSAGRSQFKLQVDGIAGRPSCVLVGVGSSRIYAATANRTVADGQWHQVGCAREGGLLTVTIDNATVGRVALPTILSVETRTRSVLVARVEPPTTTGSMGFWTRPTYTPVHNEHPDLPQSFVTHTVESRRVGVRTQSGCAARHRRIAHLHEPGTHRNTGVNPLLAAVGRCFPPESVS
jgi:hypothetical protein